jgi:hypothetical protein
MSNRRDITDNSNPKSKLNRHLEKSDLRFRGFIYEKSENMSKMPF